MAEEAAVILRAIDETTAPTNSAVAALKGYQNQIGAIQRQGPELAGGMKAGTDGMNLLQGTALRKFEHAGMRLMLGQMASMQGASPAVSSALGLISNAMWIVSSAAGATGLALAAIVAVAAIVTTAMRGNTEALKKVNDQYEKSILALKGLTSTQEQSAKRAMIQAQSTLMLLKAQLLIEQQTRTWRGTILSWMSTSLDAFAKVSRGLVILTEALTHPIKAYKDLVALSLDAANRMSTAMDAPTKAAQTLQDQITSLQNEIIKTVPVIDAMTTHAIEKFGEFQSGVVSTAKVIGEVMGSTIVGVQDAWKIGAKALINTIVDMAIKMVVINIAAAKTVAAAWSMAGGPWGMAMMAGKIAAIAALGAVAIGALSKQKATTTAAAAAAPATASITPASTTAGGAGGAAVATAQQQLVNNITINMPIQALDLASISDTQLKSLSFRVGKMLREAAAVGQFSLA